ncbi:MAG: Hercynine oxygenase [Phycisphaerae bacterium]|nr:Hercynine oxygenase [Phycisphaerae bacterium]
MPTDKHAYARPTRAEALRFLRLLDGTGRDDIASVCDMWAAAFTLRMAAATDEQEVRRYRRLAQRLREARFTLLGDHDELLDDAEVGGREIADSLTAHSTVEDARREDHSLDAHPFDVGAESAGDAGLPNGRAFATPGAPSRCPESEVRLDQLRKPDGRATGRRRNRASTAFVASLTLATPVLLLLSAAQYVMLGSAGPDSFRQQPPPAVEPADETDVVLRDDKERTSDDALAAWAVLLTDWTLQRERARVQAAATMWLAQARQAGLAALREVRAAAVAAAAEMPSVVTADDAPSTSAGDAPRMTAEELVAALNVTGAADATDSSGFSRSAVATETAIIVKIDELLARDVLQPLADACDAALAAMAQSRNTRSDPPEIQRSRDSASLPKVAPAADAGTRDTSPPAYTLAADEQPAAHADLVLEVREPAEVAASVEAGGGFPLSADEARGQQSRQASALGVDVVRSIRLARHVAINVVLIPAGEFDMGSPDAEEGRYDDEGPQRRVRITRAFYIGVCEVTQAQWRAVMGSTQQSWFKGDDLPVESITALDCQEFCRRLSQSSGMIVRLPSEAEWEYACRAGTDAPFAFGATISSQRVNFDGSTTYGGSAAGLNREQPTPVGSLEANAWGVCDMHGNVWEWCADWYARYPATPHVVDPEGPPNGEYRVLRGGSWGREAALCRSAARVRTNPAARSADSGFRVVVELGAGATE